MIFNALRVKEYSAQHKSSVPNELLHPVSLGIGKIQCYTESFRLNSDIEVTALELDLCILKAKLFEEVPHSAFIVSAPERGNQHLGRHSHFSPPITSSSHLS